MKQTARIFLLLLLLSSFYAQAQYHAVPPSPLPYTVILPDGGSLQIVGKGNDHVHWTETTDGYTVLKNTEGYYEYAVQKGKEIVSSGIRAYGPEDRSLPQMRQLLGIARHLNPMSEETEATAHTHELSPLSSQSTLVSAVPSKGSLRLLAICVEFPDLPHTRSADYMRRMLNEGVDGKPSFRDYYLQNSFGQLELNVDVAGWVTASKNFEYYGDKNGKSRTRELVQEALSLADPAVDYSRYDNDADGDVDGVIIIHSGPGAEEGGRTEYIWSHRWSIPFALHDNTFIFDYAVHPETRSASYGGVVGIGIFCHEFGHLLGLPDLYDTDASNGSSHGIGEWGLMGLGNWLGLEDYPAGLSAWSKERLGWIEPENISGRYGRFSLRPANEHPDIYKIETGRNGEYFLLENRQKEGHDAFIRGNGLAIWHINSNLTSLYPSQNRVNGDENTKGVDLEEADRKDDLDFQRNRGDNGDLFPGAANSSAFNFSTQPSSDSYFTVNNSLETGISVENIQLTEDGNIIFTHSRLLENSGEDCATAFIALEGENTVESSPSWFEFTMPREGSLHIDTRDAGVATYASLYLSCGDAEPLREVMSYNDERGYQSLALKNLPSGQKVFIQWRPIAGEENGAFSFQLRIEGEVAEQDSLALLAIYQQMDGANWQKKQNWLQTPVSGWEGVSVENGRVIGLDFSSAGLKGNLPQAFYQLSALQSLRIENNQLSGVIDGRINALQQLQHITLSEAGLSVQFLTNLPDLVLLKRLVLKDVKISQSLPVGIDKLKELEVLDIQDTELGGPLPANLGNLPNLRQLVLRHNLLSGPIPAQLGSAAELQTLDLSENRLNGNLPATLGSLWKLEAFNADRNLLTGPLPAELVSLPSLTRISLENNLLTALPENLFSSSTLIYINLNRNRIGGTLPQSVNRTSTDELSLLMAGNSLSGPIGEALKSIHFSTLDLANNQLEGIVPALKVSTYLGLNNNRLSGLQPLPVIKDGKLVLWASRNRFTFDDLLPNADFLRCASCADPAQRYAPQDTIKAGVNQVVREGDAATYTLAFDNSLATNVYAWFKDGSQLSGQASRTLSLSNFSAQNAGSYNSRITNSLLPGLTLVAADIQFQLRDKQEQQITVQAIPPKKFKDPAFELQASSDAGLPLMYSLVSGPVSLQGKQLSINGAGEAVVKITQAGNADFHPAEKEVRFTIAKATQTITAENVANKTYGESDFSLNVSSSSGQPVALQLVKGNVTLSNQLLSIQGAGAVEIKASQAGNNNYEKAEDVFIRFQVNKAPQFISFSEVQAQIFGAAPLSLTASSDAGLPVNIAVVSGPAVWENPLLTLTGAGSVRLRAAQPGNDNYLAASAVEQVFTVSKAPQEITFEEIFDQELSDTPLELSAFSSVGLEVGFQLVTGPARIENGNQLYLEDAGEVVVEAVQPGNENYLAAAVVRRSFFVKASEKLAQSIAISPLPDTVLATESLQLDWTVSSELEARVELEGPALLQDRTLIFTGSGLVSVRLLQEGNEAYNAAVPVVKEVFVAKAPQTISFSLPTAIDLAEQSLQLNATSSSGLSVSFSVITGPAEISGNVLELQNAGEVTVEASQPGDEIYAAADPVVLTFSISESAKEIQTISFTDIPDLSYSPEPITLDLSTSSGLPLTIIASGPVSLQGNSLTMMGSGTASLQIFQRGNAEFAPSDTVNISFTIMPAAQSITFEAVGLSESTFELNAQASSGLAVSYEVISGDGLLDGNILNLTGEGEVVVRASQPGNDKYLEAEPVSRTFENSAVTSIDGEVERITKIYPNPSEGVFYLESDMLINESSFYLYNAQGKLLKSWKAAGKNQQVDLTSGAAGIYQLVIQQKDRLFTYRLILQ